MSKKTKKEKILAAYRKKLRLLEELNKQSTPLTVRSTPSSTFEIKKQNKKTSKIKQYQLDSSPKYFFLDLKKSLILIVIIIALEIGLYFVKLIK